MEFEKLKAVYPVDLKLDENIGADWVMNHYHFHNVYEVYFAVNTGAEMWIGDKKYIVAPNDLFLLSTSDQHRVVIHDTKGFHRFILYFNPLYIQLLNTPNTNLLQCFINKNSNHTHCLRLTNEQAHLLLGYYKNLKRAIENKQEFAMDIREKLYLADILIFINTLYRDHQASTNQKIDVTGARGALSEIIHYIDTHFDKPLDAEAIHKVFGIHRHRLNSMFKEHTGISFHQYLVNTRIIKARELLEQGGTTTSACYESGFNDYAHFIRTFSKAMGMSPGKYTRQFK